MSLARSAALSRQTTTTSSLARSFMTSNSARSLALPGRRRGSDAAGVVGLDGLAYDGVRPGRSWFRMLGVRIDNVSMSEALATVVNAASTPDARRTFAFVNADCLNIASTNTAYRGVLAAAHRVFADGSGIRLTAKLRGIAVRDNVNGTDMFPLLCAEAAQRGLRIYLLGAAPGVAAATARNMTERFPGLVFAGTHHGYFKPEEEEDVIASINGSGADILLVALGAPRQEAWIAANRQHLSVKVAMGVGGLFDFFSGRIARAPLALRKAGLEWTWRLAQEPKRMWKRYVIGNPLFIGRCLAEQVRSAFGGVATTGEQVAQAA